VVGAVKPDIGLYNINDENRGNIMDFHRHEKGFGDNAFSYVANMGLVYLFIEVKKGVDQDIFINPPRGPLPPDYRFTVDTRSRNKKLKDWISTLGQNAHDAYVVQTHQFCTHVFSLTIPERTVRIMRWDRSGVLVTEAFDYRRTPGFW
jgi:hypothetical protein